MQNNSVNRTEPPLGRPPTNRAEIGSHVWCVFHTERGVVVLGKIGGWFRSTYLSRIFLVLPSFCSSVLGQSLNISLNRFVLHYWEIIMYMNHASEKMLWNKDYAYAYSLRNQPYTSGHPIVSFNLLLCTACSYCQGYTQQKTEQESNMRAPI